MVAEDIAVMAAEHRAMREAIHTLFAVGGAAAMDNPAPRSLPGACRRQDTTDWQSPGTVPVRVRALQRLARAGGVTE